MELLFWLLPLAFAAGCGYLAHVKGRRLWLWVILGLLFSLISLIVLTFLPARRGW